jgi:soluble lytic murein transglycosylase-like protein
MAEASVTRRDCIRPTILLALLMLCAVAKAQPCDQRLPTPGAALLAGAEKFKLIAQHCPSLVVESSVHRAAQLDLYGDGNTSVTVPMPADPAAPAQPAVPPPPADKSPPDRNAARVLSLVPALTEAARDNELDPLLLHAIAHVESRHNPQAVSPAGARGVMQVMPATARRFGVGDPEQKLHDASTNVRAGAAYLRTLHNRFNGDLKLVIAAYNAGEGAVEKHGRSIPPYPETQAYVRDVLAIYQRLTSTFSVSAQGALIARGE